LFKLCFYVPDSHLTQVKDAVFAAGAGQIGDYDRCCWQTLGQGQFRPLAGSAPHIGNAGQFSVLEEYKVELVCEEKIIKEVISALKIAHPYEEPAFDIVRLEDFHL
jgi:hypothetical protein